MVSETQHNFSNMNWFDTKHTMMENLCIYESDVGNTALLCATEKQDYKGIWLKESLRSKCEFTQQISTVWWDRCVAVTSKPPPQGWDFPGGTSGKELACQRRRYKRCGFDPGWGRSSGGGHGNPLHYSCLENPMDRGAGQATVHRVAQSWTRQKRLSTHDAHLLHIKGKEWFIHFSEIHPSWDENCSCSWSHQGTEKSVPSKHRFDFLWQD